MKKGRGNEPFRGSRGRHSRRSRQGVKSSPRGHTDTEMNRGTKPRSVVQEEGRRESGGRRGRRRKKEGEQAERDIKVFRVAKVAAAAATSKRPPDCRALASTFRARSRARVRPCMRSCTRSRSFVRDQAADRTGSTVLRFRSNRCAVHRVRAIPCRCARVHALLHVYTGCAAADAARYMERIMSQHPSEHRGTTVSPRLNSTVPLRCPFFILLS